MEYELALVRFIEVLRDCLNVPLEEEGDEKYEKMQSSQSSDLLNKTVENNDVYQEIIKKFNANNLHQDTPDGK